MQDQLRIVVLDDDPTGMQTVAGNLVLTEWTQPIVQQALTDPVHFFYILTNSRSLPADIARETVRSAARAVLAANRQTQQRLLFVSRSDSTLRSHFPTEIDAIVESLVTIEQRVPDTFFIVPAFFEGHRITRNDTHYIREGDRLVPTANTEFARDSVFAYPTSHLPQYIEHKTAGRVPASTVRSISLEMLRSSTASALERWIADLKGGVWCVVNAENYTDLDRLTAAVRTLAKSGRSFMFQSGASLVKSLTQTPDHPMLDACIVPRPGSGLIVVGSHVAKTTQQLQMLLEDDRTIAIDLDVRRALEDCDQAILETLLRIEQAHQRGKTAVVVTSRAEMKFATPAARLAAGQCISSSLSRIVRETRVAPSFIIAKGGITSHDVLVSGLQITSARTAGQIAAGVPVITLPAEHRFSGAPYVIFPGNVGGPTTLRDVFRTLIGETT